jgi:uncharacterized protein YndB with AHSA1/START domain
MRYMVIDSTETIRVRTVVPARKERVFRAWTEPSEVKRWWSIGEGWKTSFVDMDLRVGGKFTLGNEPADGNVVLITGEFLIVQPPDKLVYTWRFQGPKSEESVVKVEFRDLGDQTEVLMTHEHSAEMGPSGEAAWNAVLQRLASLLGTPDKQNG